LLAATAILLGVIPCAIACLRARDDASAVAAMQTAGSVVTAALLLLAVAFVRSVYADVALLVAALSFGGGLVFVRYLEDWR
jgi:multisubunit Na+/H+ antiporter MnhF subunit